MICGLAIHLEETEPGHVRAAALCEIPIAIHELAARLNSCTMFDQFISQLEEVPNPALLQASEYSLFIIRHFNAFKSLLKSS